MVFTQQMIDFICDMIKKNLDDFHEELERALTDELKINLPIVVKQSANGDISVDAKIKFRVGGDVENTISATFDPSQKEKP